MAAPDRPTPTPAPEGPRAPGFRVLLVEDDAEAREALRKLLEIQGYAVAEAAGGDAAVAHALAHRPEAAVIDIGLPDLDGYDVAQRIRRGLRGAPMFLIALTGYQEIEERGRSGETGFDAHLVKPVKFEQFFELLARVAGEAARPD